MGYCRECNLRKPEERDGYLCDHPVCQKRAENRKKIRCIYFHGHSVTGGAWTAWGEGWESSDDCMAVVNRHREMEKGPKGDVTPYTQMFTMEVWPAGTPDRRQLTEEEKKR